MQVISFDRPCLRHKLACNDCTAAALASSTVLLYGVHICPTYATQYYPTARLVHAIRSAVQQVHCHQARCLNVLQAAAAVLTLLS
jgi:hypothetical protein